MPYSEWSPYALASVGGVVVLLTWVVTWLCWRLRQVTRRLETVSSALALAGDGLEALDQGGRDHGRDIGRLSDRLKECWQAVQFLQAAENHGHCSAKDASESDCATKADALPASTNAQPLGEAESSLLAYLNER